MAQGKNLFGASTVSVDAVISSSALLSLKRNVSASSGVGYKYTIGVSCLSKKYSCKHASNSVA